MSNRPFKIVQGFSLGLNLASLAWGIVLGTQYLNYNKLCAYFLWRDIHFQAAPALAAQPLNTNIILSLPIKFKPNQFLCFLQPSAIVQIHIHINFRFVPVPFQIIWSLYCARLVSNLISRSVPVPFEIIWSLDMFSFSNHLLGRTFFSSYSKQQPFTQQNRQVNIQISYWNIYQPTFKR